jgi:hypothetical protein
LYLVCRTILDKTVARLSIFATFFATKVGYFVVLQAAKFADLSLETQTNSLSFTIAALLGVIAVRGEPSQPRGVERVRVALFFGAIRRFRASHSE